MSRQYELIGACSGWGAQLHACEGGPEHLFVAHIFEKLQAAGVPIAEIAMLYPEKMARNAQIPLAKTLPIIHKFNLALAEKVAGALNLNRFPIVFGGDHVNAIGTWNGVYKGSPKGPLGLIWIDAHMDSHTPETSPSGAWHGMPVAALLGYGDKHLAQLMQKEPILQPQHVVFIGVRSFEEGEIALLKKLNVRVFFMEEVRKMGLARVVQEAVRHVSQGTARFGVSLDLDVIDPRDAPGVGSPETGGVSGQELLETIPFWAKHHSLAAIEIVEYNPERDLHHKTRQWVYEILKAALL